MTTPDFITRLMGSRASVAIYAVCFFIVIAWMAGNLPWWWALIALLIAIRTRSAVITVRNYNAWLAEWRYMGGENPPPQKTASGRAQKKPKRKIVLALEAAGCAFLAFLIMAYVPNGQRAPDTLLVLWSLAGIAFVWKLAELARAFFRRGDTEAVRLPKAQKRKDKEAEVVAWLVQRASSSPSRNDAMRNLPQYSTRLLGS